MKSIYLLKKSHNNRGKTLLFASIFIIPQLALGVTYTTDSDFDLGLLNGVNHDAPNNDQLQVNETGTTFPVLWVANAGEDSVSRINTDTNAEEGRYKTWYGTATHGAWSGPAPSRTAVDLDGNVYVANRHFDGKPAQVMKILAEGGIDRNGNGVIDTSTDTNGNGQIEASEMFVLTDSNGNGKLDPDELIDERVAWAVQVGPNNGLGRSLCIDTNGHIWLGLYNSQAYYELDPDDGSEINGPISNSLRNYGCLVDGDGRLWSANLGSSLGELDTDTHAVASHSHSQYGSNYGIAVGNNKVYLASQSSRSYIEYDPNTLTFSTPADALTYTLGISVDGDGAIVLGRNPVYKFDSADGSVIWSAPHPLGSVDVRGVIPDANNDVWTINLSTHNISKFDGATGNHLATIPVGISPYTYSDATGFAARNVTNPSGIWRVSYDSGTAGTQWSNINWNNEPEGSIPAGSAIEVEARSASTLAGLSTEPFIPVTSGAPLALTGQFIGVQATLKPTDDGVSPVLSDLSIEALVDDPPLPDDLACDVDADGDVDVSDIQAIMAARNTPAAAGDVRDNDGNGIIDANDARQCVLHCNNTRCAP